MSLLRPGGRRRPAQPARLARRAAGVDGPRRRRGRPAPRLHAAADAAGCTVHLLRRRDRHGRAPRPRLPALVSRRAGRRRPGATRVSWPRSLPPATSTSRSAGARCASVGAIGEAVVLERTAEGQRALVAVNAGREPVDVRSATSTARGSRRSGMRGRSRSSLVSSGVQRVRGARDGEPVVVIDARPESAVYSSRPDRVRRRAARLSRRRRPEQPGRDVALARVGGGQVELLDVLLEHARRREAPDVRGDRRLHELDPGLRQALRRRARTSAARPPPRGSGRGRRRRRHPGRPRRRRLATADGPAVGARPALVPPAVEDGDIDDAVDGRLHAARPRGLERPARVVEPDIDALHEVAGDAHVVVLEDEGTPASLGAWRALEDVADDPLARAVGRVRLAGEDDLDGPLLVPQQARQALLVAEQQRGALVGREPAGEADGQDVRVEDMLDALERRIGEAPWRANWRSSRPRAKTASSRFCRRCAFQSCSSGMASRRSQKRPAGVSSLRASRSAPRSREELGHRPAEPGRRVDAVGDAQDRPSAACPARSRWRSRRGAG